MDQDASAAIEAVEPAAQAAVADTGVDLGQAESAEPSTQEATEAKPEGHQEREAAPEREPDGRMLPAEVKAHLNELRATNPALAGKIRDAFGQAAAIRKEFPGGLSEARAFKQFAEQAGGQDGIRELQDVAQEVAELDRLWESKDPRAVDSMAEDYPEQFVGLMPHAMETWQKHDPDGFNRNACAVVAATLQLTNEEGYSPQNLLWMAEQSLAMGDGENAKAILGKLQEWARSFARVAMAEPKPRQNEAENPDKQRAEELQERVQKQEQAMFDQAVGMAVESFAEQKIQAAIAPYIKGKQLTEGQRDTLNARVVRNLLHRLESDKQFLEAREKYSAARDRDGLIQMSRAKIEAVLPNEVKDAYRWLFGGAPAQKADPKAAPKASATPASAASQQKPWVKVSAPPKPWDVDNSRTSFEMKMKSSAVLKDGSRIYWGQSPYQAR